MSEPTAPPGLPNFLIAGVTKAGTSSLWSYLRDHPEVALAARKETRFFSRHFRRGAGWYASLFPMGAKAVGEASPDYLYAEGAPERIHRVLPDARLIFLLRDPIERAYSHYWMKLKKSQEVRTFERCVSDDIGRIRTGAPARAFRYVDIGRYAVHLARFAELFDRDRIRVLLFEDFVAEPLQSVREVCRFLGVDDAWTPSNLGETANPMTRATGVVRSRVLVYPFYAAWYPLAALQAAVPGLRPLWRTGKRLVKRAHRAINVVDGHVPPMSESVRERLQDFYAPHRDELERAWDLDVSAWG